ncbi:MAG: hypothetical protein J3Q66DRAFT_264883, partial [Benniella sp.]
LTEDICEFLNEDWLMRPSLRFACARMLAGCIMLNTMHGEALLVNTTIEMYGRGREIDVHR